VTVGLDKREMRGARQCSHRIYYLKRLGREVKTTFTDWFSAMCGRRARNDAGHSFANSCTLRLMRNFLHARMFLIKAFIGRDA
jgi:hypothetical protein